MGIDETLERPIGECFGLWTVNEDSKVNVYSDSALLPQDFDSVDAVSQQYPKA